MTLREYWREQRKLWNAMPGRTVVSFDAFMWILICSLPIGVLGIVIGDVLVALLPVIMLTGLSISVTIGMYLPEKRPTRR